MNIKKKIKARAAEIGFDLVGITTTKSFPAAYKILQKRKDNNKLPEFLPTEDIELLTTPELIMPAANSIISLGISYALSANNKEVAISTYARGKDYHQVINSKMEKLTAYIENLAPEVETKSFTDTGPLLEREIASRAGLGWIGKNNTLINEKYGSYLFLGEIMTSLKIEPDIPAETLCGNCQLCVEACPGEALISSFNCKFERCRSYLTQKKGILTETEREIIGKSFWGCDVCQEVCPYNQDIPFNLHQEFAPRLQGNAAELIEVLNFNRDNIPPKWQESALGWRGLRILKRNAIIIMGNSNKKKYLPFIEHELSNPSPILRSYAVWALGRINNKLNREKLQKLLADETDARVIKEINKLL